MTLPVWVGYGIVGATLAAVAFVVLRRMRIDAANDAEFVRPPGRLLLEVRVRGSAALLRFAQCWNQAVEELAAAGPWPKADIVKRLGPGPNKVQIQSESRWIGASGGLVGGEYVAGLILIGPNLDVLCHELAHRCEEVFEHRTDLQHGSWKARGLTAADNAYRAWLAKT